MDGSCPDAFRGSLSQEEDVMKYERSILITLVVLLAALALPLQLAAQHTRYKHID
jgi:hypothetical protein